MTADDAHESRQNSVTSTQTCGAANTRLAGYHAWLHCGGRAARPNVRTEVVMRARAHSLVAASGAPCNAKSSLRFACCHHAPEQPSSAGGFACGPLENESEASRIFSADVAGRRALPASISERASPPPVESRLTSDGGGHRDVRLPGAPARDATAAARTRTRACHAGCRRAPNARARALTAPPLTRARRRTLAGGNQPASAPLRAAAWTPPACLPVLSVSGCLLARAPNASAARAQAAVADHQYLLQQQGARRGLARARRRRATAARGLWALLGAT